MHLMQKCIFATHQMHFGIKCICNILLMQKCIFAKQNVMQKCIFAQHLCFLQSKKHSIFAQLNIFLWKMYAQNAFCRFLTFCKQKCKGSIKCICNILLLQKCIFAKQNVMQKCIFAQHLCFLQSKKHSIFAQLNIFLENVRQNAFWHQMHFCTAEHFPKENVR